VDDSLTSPASERFPGSHQPRVAAGTANYDVGSPEYLRSTFARAAAVADRVVGLWLARGGSERVLADMRDSRPDRSVGELRAMRALVRTAATAYVRRLRDEGASPERMLVLVKTAAGHPGAPGFGVRELTDDVVRWSIEAFFGD